MQPESHLVLWIKREGRIGESLDPALRRGSFLSQEPRQKIYDQAEGARYRGDDPKTHGDLGLRPAQRLQMMMDRRGKEHLPAQQTLGQKLDDDRSGFQNQDEGDDRQEKRSED